MPVRSRIIVAATKDDFMNREEGQESMSDVYSCVARTISPLPISLVTLLCHPGHIFHDELLFSAVSTRVHWPASHETGSAEK